MVSPIPAIAQSLRNGGWAYSALMGLLLLAVLPAEPLFAGNQNVYFLWGMARAGIGSLALDPLLAEADPFPLFAALVYAVSAWGHPVVFYLLFWALSAVYCHALIGIASFQYDVLGRPGKLAIVSAIFLSLHSGAVWGGLSRALIGTDLTGVFHHGIAGQGVMMGYLQPSTFGVFLLLSLLHFLKDKPRWAFLSLAMAAVFHAGYILAGTVMGAAYLFMASGKGRQRVSVALAWGGVAVLLVMPHLIYVASNFLPHSPEEAEALRDAVAATVPGNAHLDFSAWMGLAVVVQAGLMTAALLFERGSLCGRLLMALAGVGALLSVIAMFTGGALLSLTPWRLSTVILPVAVMLLMGRSLPVGPLSESWRASSILLAAAALLASAAWHRVFGSYDTSATLLWRLSLALLIASVLPLLVFRFGWVRVLFRYLPIPVVALALTVGLLEHRMQSRFMALRPEQGVIAYLIEEKEAGEMVLAPLGFGRLRINAGVAVVADSHLVHGLRLPELLQRQQRVSEAYVSDDAMATLMADYPVTAIIWPAQKEIPAGLVLTEAYRDAHYLLLRKGH